MSSLCGTLNSRPRRCFACPAGDSVAQAAYARAGFDGMRGRLVVEPARHRLGIAQFPGDHALPRVEIAMHDAEQRIELLRERMAVERRGLGFLDFLHGAALHEEALHRIERRQLSCRPCSARTSPAMPNRPPRKSSRCGARSTRRSASALRSSESGSRARRHQPVVQRDVDGGEVRDKGAIEPDQPITVVKVGESEPVFQGEIGHAT